MSLYGAQEIIWGQFAGLNLEVDPTELPANIGATGSYNVDFEGETLQNRGGATAYNSAAPTASKVQGIFAYYPRAGGRILLMAAGGTVYADRNSDGDFADANEALITGLSSTDPVDFWQFRGTLYFGTKTDGVYSWDGAAAAAALVAPITAPAAAPNAAPAILQAETFDSVAWTSTNAALTSAYDATLRKEGASALKLTMTGAGALQAFVYRALSAGATVDLSDAKELVLWVYGTVPGMQFQVGIYDDTETTLSSGPTWGRFPVWTIEKAGVWTMLRVPLGGIKPTDRDAVPGIAIKITADGQRGWTPNPVLYFDDARAQGTMEPDRYFYYATYATVDANNNVIRESAPSAAAQLDLQAAAPFRGASLGVTASGDATVNQIRLYRYRKTGVWARAKLVKTAANANATLTDYRDDSQIDFDAAAAELQMYRDAPPKAGTYAEGKHRLWAGSVVVGGTTYPNRVYLSAFNDPEAFSPSEHVNVSDPNAAGWFDLPVGERIQRILAIDELVIVFTDAGIWSVEGDGWDNFAIEPRAHVGLDARRAVARAGQVIYFLASDGIRALAPNGSFQGAFPTWCISEPVESKIRGLSTTNRPDCAMGVDERGRVHFTFKGSGSDALGGALIFDPRQPGSLASGFEKLRPGWTYYQAWPWAVMHSLRRDGNDYGQLLGGARDTNTGYALGKVYYLQRNASNAAIADANNNDWLWFSPGAFGGAGSQLQGVYESVSFNSVAGQVFDIKPQADLYNQPTFNQISPALASGVEKKTTRLNLTGYCLQAAVGSTTFSATGYTVRSVSLGFHKRR